MPGTKDSSNYSQKKYFCSKAFGGFSITPSGGCAPCCLFEKMITKPNGEYYKIWEDEISEVYNSAYMKEVRRKMLDDEPLQECRQCYQLEEHGGYSLRKQSNSTEIDPTLEYDSNKTYTPAFLDLKLNNKCNLKCRMCQPRDSHLVYNEFKKLGEKDPTFQFFTNTNLLDPDLGIPLADVPDWSSTLAFTNSFKKMLPSINKISLVGGEPLLLDEVYELIDICVNEGHASKITLVFTTNLMHVPLEKLSTNLEKFHKVLFSISLDAVGKELHYIRYPSSFEKIVSNFNKLIELKEKSNIRVQLTPTVQVYNVLYLDQVYRFVEKLLKSGIPFTFTQTPVHLTFLEFPVHLNIRILPKNVRKAAVNKLKKLLIELPVLMGFGIVKSNLEHLIYILEKEYITNHDYLPEFLYYSQTLDKERGHNGEDYLPELFNLISGISPHAPVESYHQTREKGWQLAQQGKLKEAIMQFEKSLETSTNKELDFREMAWMKMALGLHQQSLKLYQDAFRLDSTDPHILKGLALQYKIANDQDELKAIIEAAVNANPLDSELLQLKKSLGNS